MLEEAHDLRIEATACLFRRADAMATARCLRVARGRRQGEADGYGACELPARRVHHAPLEDHGTGTLHLATRGISRARQHRARTVGDSIGQRPVHVVSVIFRITVGSS